jgi:hypothetical protein
MNFKGVQTLWEKSGKFTKILSQHGPDKSELKLQHKRQNELIQK